MRIILYAEHIHVLQRTDSLAIGVLPHLRSQDGDLPQAAPCWPCTTLLVAEQWAEDGSSGFLYRADAGHGRGPSPMAKRVPDAQESRTHGCQSLGCAADAVLGLAWDWATVPVCCKQVLPPGLQSDVGPISHPGPAWPRSVAVSYPTPD